MARNQIVLRRPESWGVLCYDRSAHQFSFEERLPRCGEPYASEPVVLNVVVTRRCNMDCDYCVAHDFSGVENEDLVLSGEMIRWIRRSPFMLLVLTGGEPLLPPYDAVALRLIALLPDRGIILDTNGTLLPSKDVLKRLRKHHVMVRVSMDSIRPHEEVCHRHMLGGKRDRDCDAYFRKLSNIDSLRASGVTTAVQTVVWQRNPDSLYKMIEWLLLHGIKRWYLQRLIPSYRMRNVSGRSLLPPHEYYPLVADVAARARAAAIDCVAKMDLRHNSVFLLTSDGALYTQGSAPGQKVKLGTIKDDIDYFGYVSAPDHARRYYLTDVEPTAECGGKSEKVVNVPSRKSPTFRNQP